MRGAVYCFEIWTGLNALYMRTKRYPVKLQDLLYTPIGTSSPCTNERNGMWKRFWEGLSRRRVKKHQRKILFDESISLFVRFASIFLNRPRFDLQLLWRLALRGGYSDAAFGPS